jgi:hypothetical protein
LVSRAMLQIEPNLDPPFSHFSLCSLMVFNSLSLFMSNYKISCLYR